MSAAAGKKLGFIGLGRMGMPMAVNLLKAGYDLVCFDINNSAIKELVEMGAVEGFSNKDVALKSNILITMHPDSQHVKQAVIGRNGIFESAKHGMILIDMSSVAPSTSRELSLKLGDIGVAMVDAPVCGGVPEAHNRSLSIAVGGPKNSFEQVFEVLSVLGESVKWMGEIGSGNIAVLTQQIIVALTVSAVSEALVLVQKTGVEPERVFQFLRTGPAGSAIIESTVSQILKRDFKPGFSLRELMKDLQNAIDLAHAISSPVPLSCLVMEAMHVLKADGREQEDICSLIRNYENFAKVRFP
jgi:2-hydroxy-3-oxopropionate reductase